MKVDCHIHSLFSDGVYTVRELLPKLDKAGIEVFSITDHDTVKGIKEARAVQNGSRRFVPGIEFTCREMEVPALGKTFSIHLLGYGIDEENQALVEVLSHREEEVKRIYDQLCQKLTESGCQVERKEIPVSCGIVLQLCDVEAYIRRRYPRAGEKIFEQIRSFSAKLDQANLPVKTAIDRIHDAGGKAVWAHPFYAYKEFQKLRLSRQDVLLAMKKLQDMGLDGIEAWYLAFSAEERLWLKEEARTRGMFYTAGSDFHGSEGRSQLGVEI